MSILKIKNNDTFISIPTITGAQGPAGPQGPKGEPGISGTNIKVSNSEPTDTNVEVWINPNATSEITDLQNQITTLTNELTVAKNRIAELEEDTGWQILSLYSGISAVRSRIRRKAGVVYLEIINLTGYTLAQPFGLIPEGFRPDSASANNSYRWAAPTTGANWTRPEIHANGEISIYSSTTSAGTWTDIVVSYIAAGY
jgi:hypothetical protein